jgi:hypothetical protein
MRKKKNGEGGREENREKQLTLNGFCLPAIVPLAFYHYLT